MGLGYKSFLWAAALVSSVMAAPVDQIGALSVQNGKVVGASGQPANLRGMSFFWNIAPEARDYYNANVVNWLAEDWHVNLVRAAMAVEDNWGTGQEGYMYNADRNKNMVKTIVDAAIAKGIYVIIDWHSHWSADQSASPNRQAAAIAFFEEMATTYGNYPNVIYEVYNEPGFGEGDWAKVKSYNQAVVNAIRAIDTDNLIVVGTPQYSSAVDIATATPMTGTNLAYSFHFYASDPDHDKFKTKAETALSRGYAIFVSEWGVSWAYGGGKLDTIRMESWLNWMTTNGISWAAWSIANKNESSSALTTSAASSGNWSASDLSASGTWYKEKLSSLNPAWNAVAISPKAQKSEFSYRTTSNSLQIQWQTNEFQSIRIGDLQGRSLYEKSLSGLNSLEIQSLPQGVVTVEMVGAKNRIVRRVLLP